MSGKGSIESPGRIGTSQDPVYRLFWVAAGTATSHWLLGPNAFIHWSVPELSACPHIARQTRLLSQNRNEEQVNRTSRASRGGVCCSLRGPVPRRIGTDPPLVPRRRTREGEVLASGGERVTDEYCLAQCPCHQTRGPQPVWLLDIRRTGTTTNTQGKTMALDRTCMQTQRGRPRASDLTIVDSVWPLLANEPCR